MQADLLPIDLPPGFWNNGTVYQAKGRWHTGNLVRFHEKTIRPIGGWSARTLTGAAITGRPSAAVSWRGTAANVWLAVGTTTGLFVIDGNNVVYSITPGGGASFSESSGIWRLEVFGTYLVASYVNSSQSSWVTYVWAGATGTPAESLPEYGHAGIAGPAPINSGVPVATPERFIALLGSGAAVSDDANARLVRWPSQESFLDWTAAATNTAGDHTLETLGAGVAGAAFRGTTLIWTTNDLWTMTYVGGTFVYSFAKVGDACGLVSTKWAAGVVGSRAYAVLDNAALWMGYGKFHAFDGYVRTLPCDVADYVFGSLNMTYAWKIWAFANPRFNEVTWFYPSANATEIDRYVTYNYDKPHWTFGSLVRTTGVTQQAGATNPVPVLLGSDATVYDHETGTAHSSVTPYLESGPLELGTGDQVVKLQQLVPDEKTAGQVQARIYTSMFPNGAETSNGPYTMANPTSIRLTARQARIRFEEATASDWRVGVPRLAVRPGGRR